MNDLPAACAVAGIRTLPWRCMATFSILPGAKAWPLVLSPALGSVNYHARLRQISCQSLRLGMAGTAGHGRFAFYGGPHAFDSTPLESLERANNARFLRHVLAWLLPGSKSGSVNPSQPTFGKLRGDEDWLWRPFQSDESGQPDTVSVAFVEELLHRGETLKALPIESPGPRPPGLA